MIRDQQSEVAVFGECDSDNVGDRLIAEGVVQVLSRFGMDSVNLPLEERTVGGPWVESLLLKRSPVRRLHRELYRRVPEYTHAIDLLLRQLRGGRKGRYAARSVKGRPLVVVGGGQLLSDRSLRMLAEIHTIVRAANAERVPVLLLGVGASKPRTALSKWLMRQILRGVPPDRILVRDLASAGLLGALSPQRSPLGFAPDCAIARIRRFALEHPQVARAGRVGLAPMGWGSLSLAVSRYPVNQDAWWKSVARSLIQRGQTPVLFTTGVGDDFGRCVHLKQALERDGVVVDLLERPTTVDCLLEQLQSFEAVLSQRLHCSISVFGLGGVPLSLPWDQKLQSFFGSVGLQNRVLAPDAQPEFACDCLLERVSGFRSPESVEKELMEAVERLLQPLLRGGRSVRPNEQFAG